MRVLAAAAVALLVATGSPAADEPADSTATGWRPSRLSDFPDAARAVAGDVGWTLASPARIRRGALPWIAGAVAIGAAFYASDQELFDGVKRSYGDPVFEFAVAPGRAVEPIGNMGVTNKYWFAGLALGHATGWDPLREITGEVLESHLLAGGIRNLGEIAIGRARPFEGKGARHFDPGDGTAMPSGHASVSFELATIASHHARHPAVTVASYGLATSIALQRLDSSAHWPSDVFVGALVGTLVARSVVARHAQRTAARDAALSWLPWLDERGGVRGVAVRVPFGEGR
jgi:membrane-associated phospholipid phosphatase